MANPEWILLCEVTENPGLTAKDYAHRCRFNKPYVETILDSLYFRGYVWRETVFLIDAVYWYPTSKENDL